MPMDNIKKAYSLNRQIKYAIGREDVRIYNDGNKIVVEIPNKGETVLFGDFMNSPNYRTIKSKTTVPIGQNERGEIIYGDLCKMPHMLVAGQTGSGKSVFLNTIITALLMKNSPIDLKMILIDPKMVEFDRFKPIHHIRYVSETSEAVSILQQLCDEMDRRYAILAQAGCRDIDAYNERHKKMPKIVLVIDELADMMGNKQYKKGVEQNIVRIAQKARASGIHMILATQRPSTDIITGVIKANIPCRVGLRVFSNVDSRVIMDKGGCEMLNGYGDMLYIDGQSPTITRLQGGFISTREMENVIYQLVQDNQPDNQFKFELESASDDFRKRYKEYYG
jgi:S-DNA-T family DNA segregation ATPase FtsK/SpoIIIE